MCKKTIIPGYTGRMKSVECFEGEQIEEKVRRIVNNNEPITERLHLHGIVWGLGNGEKITNNWKYGITFTGYFVNERTIQYITKYITKIDKDHKDFQGKVLCSAGIGANYINRGDAAKHTYKQGETIETYRLRNGAKINLPVYYRNKIFTEEERENLFIDKIEKGIVWVMGQKVRIDDTEYYEALLEEGETIETYKLRNGAKINLPIYYRNKLFTEKERELLFIDKIEKGIIYVLGTKVYRDDEEYYIQLLEEGRNKEAYYRDWETDRKSTRLNSSHITRSRMPSSA